MQVGLHVSIAGGVFNAPLNAAKKGCEVFQMFTRSPQGGKAPVLTDEIVQQFKTNCADNEFTRWYVHTPYYINFASANPRISKASASIVREELERASLLEAKALMTHLGSGKDLGKEESQKKVIEGLLKTLDGYTGTTRFLIELAAGSGDILGASFEELTGYITEIERQDQRLKEKIGVCLDTAHMFAVGYDIRDEKSATETISQFKNIIGMDRLCVIHSNDSKTDFNARRDRHEHIGDGKIGQAGFRALLHHPGLKDVDFICETPPDSKEVADVKLLKSLRVR